MSSDDDDDNNRLTNALSTQPIDENMESEATNPAMLPPLSHDPATQASMQSEAGMGITSEEKTSVLQQDAEMAAQLARFLGSGQSG